MSIPLPLSPHLGAPVQRVICLTAVIMSGSLSSLPILLFFLELAPLHLALSRLRQDTWQLGLQHMAVFFPVTFLGWFLRKDPEALLV